MVKPSYETRLLRARKRAQARYERRVSYRQWYVAYAVTSIQGVSFGLTHDAFPVKFSATGLKGRALNSLMSQAEDRVRQQPYARGKDRLIEYKSHAHSIKYNPLYNRRAPFPLEPQPWVIELTYNELTILLDKLFYHEQLLAWEDQALRLCETLQHKVYQIYRVNRTSTVYPCGDKYCLLCQGMFDLPRLDAVPVCP